MNETNQQRTDASRTADLIAKNADLYERSENYRYLVNNTVWLTEADIHESMTIVGGDLFKHKSNIEG